MNRGLAHYKLGRPDVFAADFSRAVDLDPSNPKTYYDRGVAYLKIGMRDSAAADFAKAVELMPGYEPPKQQLRDLGVPGY